MSKFIDKERFVKIGRDTLCGDSFMRLKFNNDLLFYKWMLDQGIYEFKGGVEEAFELTWDFHRHLWNRRESGCATDLELAALETFEEFSSQYMDYMNDEDEEAGD